MPPHVCPQKSPHVLQKLVQNFAFAAMPVLVAGLMQSCRCSETVPSEGEPDPTFRYTPEQPKPQRADTTYPVGSSAGCQEWMVRVPNTPADFCIDRFEAHLLELRNGAWFPHESSVSPKNKTIKAVVAPNVLPQSSVNRFQAESACRNAGKRLCTLAEWKRACMGEPGFTYPYGNDEQAGKCNTGKPHLPSSLDGTDPKKWNMKNPWYNMAGFLAKTGTYPECVSSFGAYDMVGNLHEWVSTLADEKMAAGASGNGKANPSGFRVSVGNGIFMGGFYSTRNENGPGCSYMTSVHAPSQDDYSIGFRCCKDADAK